jgi:hypothetical protein
MIRDSAKIKGLIGLFFLGGVLFNYPFLSLFNLNILLFGIPLLYLYLFAIWTVFIFMIGLVTKFYRMISPPKSSMRGD